MTKERENPKRSRMWLTGAAAVVVAAAWFAAPKLIGVGESPAHALPPAEADVECTVGIGGTTDKAVTNDEAVEAAVTVAPTVGGCLDRRSDVANADKIIGGVVTAPSPGTFSGTCKAPSLKATVEVAWVYGGASTEERPKSTLTVTAGLNGTQPDVKAEVTDGPLKGYAVSAEAMPVEALLATGALLSEACGSKDGASQATAAINIKFRKPAAQPEEPAQPADPAQPANP
jgi:hypothetical protein